MNATKPEFVTDEHLEYLDDLRESGATNMYGAAPYVQTAFAVDIATARKIVAYWMQTFGDRHPQ